MEIDIVIPTVLPQRSVELAALLSQLQGLSVRVEVHEPGAPPWARVERVFGGARGEWLLQFEDDVTLSDGAIERMIPARGEDALFRRRILSFFSREAVHVEHPGFEPCSPARFHMTQALVMRSVDAIEFAAWFPRWRRDHPSLKSGIGQALGSWVRATGGEILVHYPSLVQHLPVASTISRRPRDRQSPTYRGEL